MAVASWGGLVTEAIMSVSADDVLRVLTADPLTAPFAIERVCEIVQASIDSEQGLRLAAEVSARCEAENRLVQFQEATTERLSSVGELESRNSQYQHDIAKLKEQLSDQTRIAQEAVSSYQRGESSIVNSERSVSAAQAQVAAYKEAERNAVQQLHDANMKIREDAITHEELHSELHRATQVIDQLQQECSELRSLVPRLEGESSEKIAALKKCDVLRDRAEKITVALRKSEQQRMKLAHKYSLVGAKVESLLQAEEDLNAQNSDKLNQRISALNTQLHDRKKAWSKEKDELKTRVSDCERRITELVDSNKAALERALNAENSVQNLSSQKSMLNQRCTDLEHRLDESKQLMEKWERNASDSKRIRESEWAEKVSALNAQLVEKQAEYERVFELEVRSRSEEEARRIHRHYQEMLKRKLQEQGQKASLAATSPPPTAAQHESSFVANFVKENEVFRSNLRQDAEIRIEKERSRTINEYDARLTSLDQERKRALEELSSVRAELSSVQMASLRSERSLVEMSVQVQHLNQQVEDEEKRKSSLAKLLDDANSNIARLTSIINNEMDQRKACEANLIAQSRRVRELEASLDLADKTCKDLHSKVDCQLIQQDLAGKADDLAKQLRAVQQESSLAARVVVAQHQADLREKENQYNNDQIAAAGKIGFLEERVKSLERENTSLIQNLEAKVTAVKSQKHKMKSSICELQEQLDDQKLLLQQHSQENERAVQQKVAALTESKKEIQVLQSQIADLQRNLEEVNSAKEHENSTSSSALREQRLLFQSKISRIASCLTAECAKLRSKVVEQKGLIQRDLQDTQHNVQNSLSRLLFQVKTNFSKSALNKLVVREEIVDEFQSQHISEVENLLSRQQEEHEKKIAALQQTFDAAIISSQERLQDCRNEVDNWKNIVDQMETRNQGELERNRELQLSLDKEIRDSDQMRSQKSLLSTELASCRQTIDSQLTQLESLRSSYNTVSSQHQRCMNALSVVAKFGEFDRATIFSKSSEDSEFETLEWIREKLCMTRDQAIEAAKAPLIAEIAKQKEILEERQAHCQELQKEIDKSISRADQLSLKFSHEVKQNEKNEVKIASLENAIVEITAKAQKEAATKAEAISSQARSKPNRRSSSIAEQQMTALLSGSPSTASNAPPRPLTRSGSVRAIGNTGFQSSIAPLIKPIEVVYESQEEISPFTSTQLSSVSPASRTASRHPPSRSGSIRHFDPVIAIRPQNDTISVVHPAVADMVSSVSESLELVYEEIVDEPHAQHNSETIVVKQSVSTSSSDSEETEFIRKSIEEEMQKSKRQQEVTVNLINSSRSNRHDAKQSLTKYQMT